jgi:site-specific recombinase XerD
MSDEPFAGRLRDFHVYLLTELQRSKQTAFNRVDAVQRCAQVAGVEPTDLTLNDVMAYKRDLLLAGRVPRYVTNICYALKDWFTYIDHHEIAEQITVPRGGPRPLPKFLTQEEVAAFLSVLRNAQDRAMFYTLAYTGLRAHELLKLTPLDINLAEKSLRIKGKGGKTMSIQIGEPAIAPLRKWLDMRSDQFSTVFYTTRRRYGVGKPITYKNLQKRTLRIGQKAGITHRVSPHQFRHAIATSLLENGAALTVVSRQLRHSDLKTTMVYLHIVDKTYKDAFERYTPQYG